MQPEQVRHPPASSLSDVTIADKDCRLCMRAACQGQATGCRTSPIRAAELTHLQTGTEAGLIWQRRTRQGCAFVSLWWFYRRPPTVGPYVPLRCRDHNAPINDACVSHSYRVIRATTRSLRSKDNIPTRHQNSLENMRSLRFHSPSPSTQSSASSSERVLSLTPALSRYLPLRTIRSSAPNPKSHRAGLLKGPLLPVPWVLG